MKRILICSLFLPLAVLAQTDTSGQPVPVNLYDALSQAKASAVQGMQMIKDQLLDPTSFTLLKVYVTIGIPKKHPDKPYWYGCVRFVGSNRMGGREQTWGLYAVNSKSGKVTGTASDPNQPLFPCNMHLRKNEISVEITSDVKKLLASTPHPD